MELNQQKNNEVEINLREIFSVLMAKMGIIILSGVILSLLVMVGTKLFVTPQYQSVTKMYVLTKQDSNTLTNSDLQTSALLTKDYEELIRSRTVTEYVIKKLELDLSHEELTKKVDVYTTTDTRIVAIKVLDEDPYVARDIATAIRDTAAKHIKNVMDSEAVNVVDKANVPKKKYSPNILKNGILAGVLGCFLAIAVILIRYISNDTVKSPEEVERYLRLSTLGTIPLNSDEEETPKKRIKNYRRR